MCLPIVKAEQKSCKLIFVLKNIAETKQRLFGRCFAAKNQTPFYCELFKRYGLPMFWFFRLQNLGKNALAYERCFSARKKIKIGKKCKSANGRLCKKARICESPHFCDAIKNAALLVCDKSRNVRLQLLFVCVDIQRVKHSVHFAHHERR